MGHLKLGYILGCVAFTGIAGTNLVYLIIHCTICFSYGFLFLDNLDNKTGNILFLSLYLFMVLLFY